MHGGSPSTLAGTAIAGLVWSARQMPDAGGENAFVGEW
jgi:hypothetical protein